MAKIKDVSVLTGILEDVSNIDGIEKLEIIDVPEDVSADIGIKIKLKKDYSWIDINHKINDLSWNIFEKIGEYPFIYREYE